MIKYFFSHFHAKAILSRISISFIFYFSMILLPLIAMASISSLTISNTSSSIKFSNSFTGTPTYRQVFIDSDNNKLTGYAFKGTGVDYLLENGNLYRFAGTSQSNWSWKYVTSSLTFTKYSTSSQWTISLSLLGSVASTIQAFGGKDSPWEYSSVSTYNLQSSTPAPTPTPTSSPTPPPTSGTTKTINPLSSSAIFNNPERGFHNFTGISTSLSEHNADVSSGSTLALLALNDLGAFANGSISSTYLNQLQTQFNIGRSAGIKYIIIPSYHDQANFNSDPSISVIKNHISQLAPVFNSNRDVIYAIHAGFIGAWGEWYYTQYSISSKADIFMTLLNQTDSRIKVSLRTPAYKISIFNMTAPGVGSLNSSQIKRVGHFNDCFLADSSDMGTGDGYSLSGDWRDFVGTEAKTLPVPVGGETCAVSSYSSCSNTLNQMARQGWSYINIDYHPDVIQQWKNGGCFDTIRKRLGYRFAIKSATFPTTATVNSKMSVSFSIENSGFAPLVNPRPVKLVLYNSNGSYIFDLNQNPMQWAPGTTRSFTATVDLSSPAIPAGDYNMALYLPDSSSSIANSPKYSIQLANTGTWDATRGWNILKDGSTAVVIRISN